MRAFYRPMNQIEKKLISCGNLICAYSLAALQQFYCTAIEEAHISSVIPAKCQRKDETHVVTCYSLFPKLEAIWARRAGTFPVERPRIGRHWNYPQRHPPYRLGAIAPGLIGFSDRLVAAPGSKPGAALLCCSRGKSSPAKLPSAKARRSWLKARPLYLYPERPLWLHGRASRRRICLPSHR